MADEIKDGDEIHDTCGGLVMKRNLFFLGQHPDDESWRMCKSCMCVTKQWRVVGAKALPVGHPDAGRMNTAAGIPSMRGPDLLILDDPPPASL